MADPVPTEANGNLSNSLKHILGHVFLKSEPDPFTKVSVLFFSEEASKIRALKPCPLLIKSAPFKAALSFSFSSHRYFYEKMHQLLYFTKYHTVESSLLLEHELVLH